MKGQAEFDLTKHAWGGRRKNAGRKRIHSKGISHSEREGISSRYPVHISFKVSSYIRNHEGIYALRLALRNASQYVSILHYSLQTNHLHLIIEAESNDQLSRGMMSFRISFSKKLGKGSLKLERYHLHVLKTVRENKNAFRYVVFNDVHHSKRKTMRADLFSSVHLLDKKALAREFKISIIDAKIDQPIELDQPTSWLAKQGLKPT